MSDEPTLKIAVTENGPYRLTGTIPVMLQTIVTDAEGTSREWLEGRSFDAAGYDLCRCGQSGEKPFCDGTHLSFNFDGTEVASRQPYIEQADVFEGPKMTLTDAGALCAYARFCDADGQIWSQVEETDDPVKREMVTREAARCPSGRLVAWTSIDEPQALEPELQPSIGLVEDPEMDVSGPLWIRGGIAVESSDGTQYEIRNRVTLCRCGESGNKPFCDGTHASIRFKDGL